MEKNAFIKGTLLVFTIFGFSAVSRGVDFHVGTAQDLQNALTVAAANGADNNIFLTNGYYTGNFNFNAASANNLTLEAEPGVTNTQITFDGAGTGRDLNLANSGTGNFTVQGITFLRNCGSAGIGALRISAGGASIVAVQNCQFLSPTNASGIGFELPSALNVNLRNCTVTGIAGGGTGISISGVAGTVSFQNCAIAANDGNGVVVYGAGVVNATGNTITGNNWGLVLYSVGTITISANNITGNSGYGFYCNSGTSMLAGNTFAGNSGGGASCGGDATLASNTFTGNSSAGGGGAQVGGNATLTGNTFIGNYAYGSAYQYNGLGGGIYCSGTATIISNTFTGNVAGGSFGDGGGACCAGPATIVGNTFTGNSAISGLGAGGGLYCLNGPAFIISSNIFLQNAAGSGGGIYVTGPNVTLQDDLLANNSQTSASAQGGGLWVDATSALNMINNTVFSNTAAGSGGGAAFNVTGTVELLNVYNNIIWGNSAAANGGDVWLAGTGQQKLFEFNDVDSVYGVWDIAQNNVDLSPQFFDPVNGDLHLQSASPCRNAGTTNIAALPANDLDGNARTNNAGMVDLGCYEFNTTAAHPADTNNAFVITAAEFNAYAAAWKSGQTWSNAPNVIPANYLTRAGYLLTNGGAYHNDGSARPVNWKTGP